MEVAGTGIVSESFPCFENFFFTGKCEGFKVRKFFDPSFKIGEGGGTTNENIEDWINFVKSKKIIN